MCHLFGGGRSEGAEGSDGAELKKPLDEPKAEDVAGFNWFSARPGWLNSTISGRDLAEDVTTWFRVYENLANFETYWIPVSNLIIL
jgi:hypothetical protein